LLLATRGQATPESPRLHDSVITIERSTHSKKPEAFRELIEELYPTGPHLELFARQSTPGWKAWGDEVATQCEGTIEVDQ
jgi:N6-adenosine-specific RNA methylase IME4